MRASSEKTSGRQTMSSGKPSWIHDQNYPFQGRSMEIDGCLVHYLDEGSGPVLLMLHGNPFWSFAYRDIILRLRDCFRCLAPDFPGFGLSSAAKGYDFRPISQARVIDELLTRLDIREWTLLCNDWGGPIGLSVAGRQADRVKALVI